MDAFSYYNEKLNSIHNQKEAKVKKNSKITIKNQLIMHKYHFTN